MKKTESNNSEEKTTTTVKLKVKNAPSLTDKNQNQGQEKTQDNTYKDFINSYGEQIDPNEILDHKSELDKILESPEMIEQPFNEQMIEDAKIEDQNNISSKMDEIIKNNDKFETIRVLMEILCKELGISVESQFGEIHKALVVVTERYYKSMEDWRNMTKNGVKIDIRQ